MWYFSIPRFVLALALILIAQVSAADLVRFTVDGEILQTKLGYTAGQNFSFSFVLRDYQPETLRVSPNPPNQQSACCSGQFAWSQDLPTEAHLWSDVYGTGLSGNWNPIITASHLTTSSLSLWLGHSPSQTLDFQSFEYAGINSNTGLFANGFRVTGFQTQVVYLGLDALGVYGDNLFGSPVPDPTDLFSGMFGTYARDPSFSYAGRFYVLGPNGADNFNFRVDTLTISAVPVPAAVWLFGSGLLTLLMKLQSRKKITCLTRA